MKILITGAGGFIGSHLFDYLSTKHNVIGLDNYSLGTYRHPKIYKIDLLNKGEVQNLVNEFRPEVIYHLAAWAHEGLSQFMPMKITDNNYTAFLNILTPAITKGLKRFILASSMSVYGDQKPPFKETLARKPVDIYGVNKTAMEQSLQILSKVHRFEHVIFRPHNVYGPRQNMSDPYRNVLAIWMNSLMLDKAFYIYGDGEQTRAFSYIDDVVPYLEKMITNPFTTNEIFNIGPIEESTLNSTASMLLGIANKGHLEPIHVPDRPAEVKHAYCSNDKAVEILDYQTSTPLKEGLKKMWNWATSVGYQEPIYLEGLEIVNENTPETWVKKLI